MKVRLSLAALLGIALSLCCGNAYGHFVWVRLTADQDKKLTAHAYFAETPTPDRDELVAKIAKSKVELRALDGQLKPVTLQKSGQPDASELTAAAGTQAPCSLEAMCDYGVYDLHNQSVLLQYYARAVSATSAEDIGRLGAAKSLALDIVPTCESGKLKAVVLWKGEPQKGLLVSVIDKDKKRQKLVTDEQGAIIIPAAKGAMALLVSFTEKDRAGERDGRKYSSVGHYATLTLDVPAAAVASVAAKEPKSEKAAEQLLAKARGARAVWDHFPGFTADVLVKVEQRSASGKLSIDKDGRLSLELAGLPEEDTKWAKQHLRSLVQHRMPDGSLGDGASLVQEEGSHPLGQRIRLAEEVMGSEYRIKDDVVTQVNRSMGPMRLTINVLEVTRNPEGKYLPSVFSVSMWDSATGNLTSSQLVTHAWMRLGKFDLPRQIREVDSRHGGNEIKTIELSAHSLLPSGQSAKLESKEKAS